MVLRIEAFSCNHAFEMKRLPCRKKILSNAVSRDIAAFLYSHSIVLGGLELMS